MKIMALPITPIKTITIILLARYDLQRITAKTCASNIKSWWGKVEIQTDRGPGL